MESLKFTSLIPCKSSSLIPVPTKFANHQAIGQLGFAPLWKRRCRRVVWAQRSLPEELAAARRTALLRWKTRGGRKGCFFGRREGDSGAVLGFNLVPPPTVSETKVIDSPEDVVLLEWKNHVTHNVVFVTAEAAPYSKTGGLGDVCGSLPIVLAARGHRVMVVSPRYQNGTAADQKYSGAVDLETRIKVYCFGGEQEVSFFHEFRAGVDWVRYWGYFACIRDHPSYHRPGNPYGDSFGAFGDNQFRFTLLCHAACEAPLVLPLAGGDLMITCPSVQAFGCQLSSNGVYKDARSVLVIHNLAHQVDAFLPFFVFEPGVTYKNLGLPAEWYGALEWVFPTWARTHALDTGEGYSWEITTAEGGYGITNGVDVVEWNPSTDVHIASRYSTDDLSGKVQCKLALQKELGLPIRRIAHCFEHIDWIHWPTGPPEGIDLIQSGMPQLMEDDVQFVMLGSGDPLCEDWMRAAEATYKDKFRGWVGFNVPVSHRITAGCDILLMPSRFEPCGLNQLYAMRYGTVPVVHSTGGLRDTVMNFNPYAKGGQGDGTGWTFSPLTKESMLAALRLACRTFTEYRPSWEGLMKRCMERDFTWESAAIKYEQFLRIKPKNHLPIHFSLCQCTATGSVQVRAPHQNINKR
ncbi:starch synthase 1 [Pyrus ussuriensis x Pyrus communis]|uniref:Starch synthase 1 n=1 Tax=Pyrus ussuriensis x Pyrus communis TaxID=2448454 RepID=A0A5N5F109_9ROSA|nr:starch synthase 1 [Pyrus ussuriensis x Pyrus communis]